MPLVHLINRLWPGAVAARRFLRVVSLPPGDPSPYAHLGKRTRAGSAGVASTPLGIPLVGGALRFPHEGGYPPRHAVCARVNSLKSSTCSTNVDRRIIKDAGGVGAPTSATAQAVSAVRHLQVDEGAEGQRLDNFLVKMLKGVPKTHLYRVIRSGEVRVNRARAQADTRLHQGDQVRVPPMRVAERSAATSGAPQPPSREFPILFEDECLLAVDKPAGVAVHGGSGVSFGVIEQLRRARPEQRFLELVHRLDRETSGVLLLAKKRSVLTRLQAQFRSREVRKTYLALVLGAWPLRKKVIDLPLVKSVGAHGERVVRTAPLALPRERAAPVASARETIAATPGAQRAITRVSVRQRLRDSAPEQTLSLLEVGIDTGRTHQIRVHLASQGHPIAGDERYGDFELNKALARPERGPRRLARMFLHAHRLQFQHPVTHEVLEVVSPLPEACEAVVAALIPEGAAAPAARSRSARQSAA